MGFNIPRRTQKKKDDENAFLVNTSMFITLIEDFPIRSKFLFVLLFIVTYYIICILNQAFFSTCDSLLDLGRLYFASV